MATDALNHSSLLWGLHADPNFDALSWLKTNYLEFRGWLKECLDSICICKVQEDNQAHIKQHQGSSRGLGTNLTIFP